MVAIMLAVNNEYGNPDGRISGAELGRAGITAMDLTAARYPRSYCPRFSAGDGWIKISRRKFPVASYRAWVGNWCWDGVEVGVLVAVDIATYLRTLGWKMEGGDCHLGDLWDSGAKFRPSDIAAACMTAKELAARKSARAKEMIQA